MSETRPDAEHRVAMYRRMVLCRRFEERVYYLFLEGRLPGTIHQSQGQEAAAVGVCSALEAKDMITSTHRPHSHALARGVSVNSLMAELFAKTAGCCGGKGGSTVGWFSSFCAWRSTMSGSRLRSEPSIRMRIE